MITKKKFGFIGFGLIGGTIAKACKKYIPSCHITVYNHHASDNSTDTAVLYETIDCMSSSLETGFQECDVIFLCAPVLANIAYLEKLKGRIHKDCIITDVGSVKGSIHAAADKLGLSNCFIGGHPMAGSEKTGYEHSNPMLLENAYYILTPSKGIRQEQITFMTELVRHMKAIPVILGSLEHDHITAAVSHIPHIIAAELVNLVKMSDTPDEKMRMLAAGGFKDITRIASSSPVMWQNICLSNQTNIKLLLDAYIQRLSKISNALAESDGTYLYDTFQTAGRYRLAIPNEGGGLMNQSYKFSLDIEDKYGSIAEIAVILSNNQISIKNIGISYNREFQPGALCIEFYDAQAMEKALEILRNKNYMIYA